MDLEGLATAFVLAVGMAPLAWLARRRTGRLLALAVLWAAGSVGFAFVASEYRQSVDIPRPETVTDRPTEIPTAGYVTSRECRSCHPGQYETWHASFHRTMTQPATAETVLGDFDDVTVEVNGRTHRLYRKGDEFRADFPDPDWTGPEQSWPRLDVPLVQTTGSHHMQAYWFSTGEGRRLGMFPLMWLIEARRWVPRGAAFLQPPDDRPATETARWNDTCLRCHATHGRPRFDWEPPEPWERTELATDTLVSELGIACEACHGPGEEHVARHRDPRVRYQEHLSDENSDTGAVHPGELPATISSHVCGQCHVVSFFRLETDLEPMRVWNEHGDPYRPGQDLTDTRFLIQPRENLDAWTMQEILSLRPDFLNETHWSDGMVRVSGREFSSMLDSPCYNHDDPSKDRMSCFSCHEMHPDGNDPRSIEEWREDQLKPGMRGDEACTGCHEKFATPRAAAEHSRHEVDSSGTRCYNCHMSYTSYGLLKALRSHTVDSPTVRASLETGRPNACNQCHLDQTLEWTAKYLDEWWEIESPELTAEQRELAAAALWTLKGDAGQRALMAWSFGWEDALETSGTGWVPPYLVKLMLDPYPAVRYIAARSLRRLPGYETVEYDFLGEPMQHHVEARVIYELWEAMDGHPLSETDPAERARRARRLLITPDGGFEMSRARALDRERDNRPVVLGE